jgi:hypothetical protein
MTSANVIAVFVDCKSIVPVRQGFGYYPALDEDNSSATMQPLSLEGFSFCSKLFSELFAQLKNCCIFDLSLSE